MNSDIAADYGPDGALYILQYSVSGYSDNKSALIRIDYTGPIDDACAPATTSLVKSGFDGSRATGTIVCSFQAVTLPTGARGLEAFDLAGRKVWTYMRNDASAALRVEFPKRLASGLLRVRLIYSAAH